MLALAPTLSSVPLLLQSQGPDALQPQLPSVAERFAQRAPEQAADHSQCIMRCHGQYESFLIVNATTTAGLDDRLAIIRLAHELASSLCAQLVLATPHDMLSRSHNRNVEVQRVWWWDRYFDLPLHPQILMADQLDGQALPSLKVGPTLGRQKYNDALPDRFDDQLAADWAKAAGATEPFVWSLSLCWMDWTLRAAPLVQEICKDHSEQFGPSSLVSLAASTAKAAMGLTDQSLYTLHVRRTDTTAACNTSVSRVVEYMQCADDGPQSGERSIDANNTSYTCQLGQGESGARFALVHAPTVAECSDSCDRDRRCVGFDVIFRSTSVADGDNSCRLYGPNTPGLNQGGVVEQRFVYCSKPKLVLFTDETDEGYTRELTTELAKLPRWGGGVIHGDPVLESMLDAADSSVSRLEPVHTALRPMHPAPRRRLLTSVSACGGRDGQLAHLRSGQQIDGRLCSQLQVASRGLRLLGRPTCV